MATGRVVRVHAVNQSSINRPHSRRYRRRRKNRRPVARARVGSWVLTRRLGRGSCTDIHEARPATAGGDAPSDYVIKILRADFADDPVAIDTIKREAAAGRCVSNPHLISVLADHSQAPPHYVVLPRLQGATVRQAIDGVGPFTIPQALWIARQVAEAVSEMHVQGLAHCDIKPANVIVATTGHATLIDLGFASPIRRLGVWEAGNATAPAVLRGSLDYIAPEMLTSSTAAGSWSDVYSLGVTIYEMLTGRLPFRHDKPMRMAEAHLREIPPSPRTFVPSIPRSVARLLSRMLAKSPERRPDDIVDELRRLEIETFGLRAA